MPDTNNIIDIMDISDTIDRTAVRDIIMSIK